MRIITKMYEREEEKLFNRIPPVSNEVDGGDYKDLKGAPFDKSWYGVRRRGL